MSTHKSHDDKRTRRNQFKPEPAHRTMSLGTAVTVVAGAILLTALVFVMTTRQPEAGGIATAVAAAGADVRLDAAQFDDGQAKFFTYTNAAKQTLKFFVLKSADGVIRAAFDTCDVCYRARKGYRQVGDTMVCNNCGQVFRSVDINVLHGGCNPVPLDRTVQGGQVVLTAAALQAGAFYF